MGCQPDVRAVRRPDKTSAFQYVMDVCGVGVFDHQSSAGANFADSKWLDLDVQSVEEAVEMEHRRRGQPSADANPKHMMVCACPWSVKQDSPAR